MSTRSPKDKKHEPVIIEILNYDNFESILSKIVIPFTEVIGISDAPDVYASYEKIPFEKRDPFYQTVMRQEFADAMRTLQKDTLT